jgi:predicted aspartyl protease
MLSAEPRRSVPERLSTVIQNKGESALLKFEFVDRSLIVIPVFVNGSGPHRFLLDTGAGITVLATKLARRLNIPFGRTEGIFSAGGSIGVNIQKLEVLKLGDIRIRGPEVAIADFDLMRKLDLDGILGGDRLKWFNVSIDYANRVVRIETV